MKLRPPAMSLPTLALAACMQGPRDEPGRPEPTPIPVSGSIADVMTADGQDGTAPR